jgi:hypothetical protein
LSLKTCPVIHLLEAAYPALPEQIQPSSYLLFLPCDSPMAFDEPVTVSRTEGTDPVQIGDGKPDGEGGSVGGRTEALQSLGCAGEEKKCSECDEAVGREDRDKFDAVEDPPVEAHSVCKPQIGVDSISHGCRDPIDHAIGPTLSSHQSCLSVNLTERVISFTECLLNIIPKHFQSTTHTDSAELVHLK